MRQQEKRVQEKLRFVCLLNCVRLETKGAFFVFDAFSALFIVDPQKKVAFSLVVYVTTKKLLSLHKTRLISTLSYSIYIERESRFKLN